MGLPHPPPAGYDNEWGEAIFESFLGLAISLCLSMKSIAIGIIPVMIVLAFMGFAVVQWRFMESRDSVPVLFSSLSENAAGPVLLPEL